jgi:hypothetical protein
MTKSPASCGADTIYRRFLIYYKKQQMVKSDTMHFVIILLFAVPARSPVVFTNCIIAQTFEKVKSISKVCMYSHNDYPLSVFFCDIFRVTMSGFTI